MDQFTQSAHAAIQRSEQIAAEHGQQQIDTLHLLLALLSQDDGVVLAVLQKLAVPVPALQKDLESALKRIPQITVPQGAMLQVFVTQDLRDVLTRAAQEAKTLTDEYVSTEHFLLAMLQVPGAAADTLVRYGVTHAMVLGVLKDVRGTQRITDQNPESKYQALERYGRNLTQLAKHEKLDPVIGRDGEIRRVMQVLSRRTKNNPVLIGEPDVGKTAIAEGLARRIVAGDVPEGLKGKRVLALD
ncbi:MAG: type VI secretion system ATPase TssH, partial [Candidatus Kerfeldbacteria bacterium]|nr:type VI secretion system ATPase TssH [Candidatus Kerfeldbacteria bacterium]